MAEQRLKVLVVDDHGDTRRWLIDELSLAGLLVRGAPSGEQALEDLAQFAADAVLLDVRMLGMDGFATCEQIRERDADLPVLFMTGLGETEHVLRGFAAGANDYVTKPVSIPEVLARLNAHTRSAQLVCTTREAVDANERAIVALGRQDVLWCNEAARRIFAQFPSPDAQTPPDGDVTARLVASVDGLRDPQHPAGGLLLRIGDTPLRVTLVAEPTESHCIVMLSLAQQPADAPTRLTARESEVLLWVARGKTNRDIADILGMSPRTVNKHLEHIFEKLGVETRAAAAALASGHLP